jgi:MFS family permease
VSCQADLILGGVVITQDFLEVHDLVGPSKTTELSTVTAIYDVGCFFGAVVAFTIGERLGRKKAILLGTTTMAVGAILQTTSFSLAQMFVGRIILGLVVRTLPYLPPGNLFLTGIVLEMESIRQQLLSGKPRHRS